MSFNLGHSTVAKHEVVCKTWAQRVGVIGVLARQRMLLVSPSPSPSLPPSLALSLSLSLSLSLCVFLL